MPSYIDQGGASAVTTATAPAYPTTVLAGDFLVLFVSSDQSGIGTPSDGGWTDQGGVSTGGNVSVRTWVKTAAGGETGTVTVNVTSGTKGVAHISRYRPTTGGNSLTAQAYTVGVDTDASTTAYSATGSSWTSVTTTDMIMGASCVITTGSFSGNATSPTIAQAGATVTNTARFAGRTGTNTIYYGLVTGDVTAGGTGAPVLTATLLMTTGTGGSGETAFVLIRELAPPAGIPRIRTARQTAVTRSRSY
jgi:hypothetical protein